MRERVINKEGEGDKSKDRGKKKRRQRKHQSTESEREIDKLQNRLANLLSKCKFRQ